VNRHLQVEGDAAVFARALSELFVELDVKFPASTLAAVARVDTDGFGDFEFLRTRLNETHFVASRSEALASQSRHNHFYIACVLSGGLEVCQSNRRIELHASDIALLDSSLGYQVHVRGAHDVLWIRVPRHRLEGRLPLPMEVTAQRIDGVAGEGRLVFTLLQATLDELGEISQQHALRITNTLLDLFALCLETPAEPSGGRSDLMLRRVQNYIESHLSDANLSLARVAQQQSVSVRYLNKLFAKEGSSAARWIRTRRLERCRLDIESPDMTHRSISEIALSHGFNDASTFNRAFKSYFGVTPRSLRAKRS